MVVVPWFPLVGETWHQLWLEDAVQLPLTTKDTVVEAPVCGTVGLEVVIFTEDFGSVFPPELLPPLSSPPLHAVNISIIAARVNSINLFAFIVIN